MQRLVKKINFTKNKIKLMFLISSKKKVTYSTQPASVLLPFPLLRIQDNKIILRFTDILIQHCCRCFTYFNVFSSQLPCKVGHSSVHFKEEF